MSDKDGGFPRRSYLQWMAVAGGAAAIAGCTSSGEENGGEENGDEENGDKENGDEENGDEEQPEQREPTERMETAEYASVRQFDNHTYERIHTYRKRRAIETVLADPEVNDIVSDWIAGFEVYEPLTNTIETLSLQGPSSATFDESGFDGGEEAEFEITAESRQTIFALVDRHTDEILALEITEPEDVSWTKEQDEDAIAIGEMIHEYPDIADELGDFDDLEWYPSWKSAGGGFTGLGAADLPHGEGATAVLYVKDGDGIKVVSVFIDGSDPEEPEIVSAEILDSCVEFPLHELAEAVETNDESLLDIVPNVEFEQRPYYTANDGYHRIETPDESFEQNGWNIEWEPAEYQGFTVSAEYEGAPVFEAMNTPMTITGYYLPPREGRNTLDWYFPDHDTVFTGDLMFWDVHGQDFGGPGMLGKVDYPERNGTPAGFMLKGHYHTGAVGLESIDFHSGFRYGPYNYDISYEFYEDGIIKPVFRRQGPGFVKQFVDKVVENGEGDTYVEGDEFREPVVQHYTSAQAIDVTPGTEDGVTVELFDGEEWTLPDEEFYVEGDSTMLARFSNPDGSEAITLPMTDDTELVVVRRDADEIGPGEDSAHRLTDEESPSDLYHPAQYVDGDPIQGERVIVWYLMVGATNQMPYPAAASNFATVGELKLSGY